MENDVKEILSKVKEDINLIHQVQRSINDKLNDINKLHNEDHANLARRVDRLEHPNLDPALKAFSELRKTLGIN